jgi:hypothetical protein
MFMKAGTRVVFTTAHLCDCRPLCGNLLHLKAMCQRCHLRVDQPLHTENARRTREAKAGQARLFA